MHPTSPNVVPCLLQASLALVAQFLVHFRHAVEETEVRIRPIRQVLKVAHRSRNFLVRHSPGQAYELLSVIGFRSQ